MYEGEPKIVLLVRLLSAIDEGRSSFEDLKDRIAEGERKPSTRSLRRYLAILAQAGFPWYFDRDANLYRFAGGYSLKRLDLNARELFGLVALRSLGASLGGTIGGYVDEVTQKLVGSAGSVAKQSLQTGSPFAFRISEVQLDEEGERSLALLGSAERSLRSAAFRYEDKEGQRTQRLADPYGFVVSSGRVYCVAYDRDRRDMRVFAVDSIHDVDVTAKTFVKPKEFDIESFAAASISGVLHGEATSEVRVTFAARVAKAASAARVVGDQSLEWNGDGSVDITYRVADVEELLRWVLSWGAEAEVVDPPAVRARFLALLHEILAKY